MEQFVANGLCKGSVYALIALGFGLIYTTSGVFHIAHAFVLTSAAYGCYWLGAVLKLPMFVAALLALALAAALAVIIEAFVYRPLDQKKASSAVVMISSFGVYIVGVNIIAGIFGHESKIIRSGVETTWDVGAIILTQIQLLQLGCGVIIFLTYLAFLRRTTLGRICRAVADDSTLASVLGVRVEGTRMLVFALGSILAATGAVLTALDVGMDPHGGMPMMLVSAVACIIGGMHRFLAPALGGLLLGMLQSLVVWKTSARWESGITFAILILFLLFRPQGILGRAERPEETP